MKRIIYILYLLVSNSILFSAPVKTPAPKNEPIPKSPLPEVAVLVSFDGYSDFYEFTASQDNYNLSAIYQSVMFMLPEYQTNFKFIEMNKMQFIPLSLEEDRKAIEILGVDYLIKINYHKLTVKTCTIEFAGLWSDGTRIVSNKILLGGTPGPDIFEQVYTSMKKVMKYMTAVENGKKAGQKEGMNKEQVNSFIYTYLTNVNVVTIKTNALITKNTNGADPSLVKTFYDESEIKILTVYGAFRYLEVVNVLNLKTYTNQKVFLEEGYDIPLYPGINILNFSMEKTTNKKEVLPDKKEKVFLINQQSLSSTSLNLKEYAYVPVHHIFLSVTLGTFEYSFVNFQFGIRFGISTHSKLKLGIGYNDRLYGNQAFFTIGYEHAVFNDLDGPGLYCMEYTTSFFIDLNLNGSSTLVKTGFNFRFNPLLSFSLGFDLGITHYSSSPGFGVFARYEIYIPYPTTYKNYEVFN